MLRQHDHHRIDAGEMLGPSIRSTSATSRRARSPLSAAIGAEAMARVPPGETERRREQRRLILTEQPDRIERRAGVGMRLFSRGEPGRAVLNAQEQVGGGS